MVWNQVPIIKRVLLASYVGGTTVLGFRRGYDSYKYDTEKRKKTFLYSDACYEGLFGIFGYVNPITFVFSALPKEIYRIEVNLRDLKEEKNTDYYHKLN